MKLLDFFRKKPQPEEKEKGGIKKTSLPPAQVSRDDRPRPGMRDSPLGLLTRREKETLFLLLKGHSMKEAAGELGVSVPTINTHINGIYKKFGVKSRPQLLLQYLYLLEQDKIQ
jgi:DNA-binding CsgD family transcriptional regulator